MKKQNRSDKWFNRVTFLFAAGIPLLFFALIVVLIVSAWPAIKAFGWQFLIGRVWDPVKNDYGALPFIYGTLVSSFLALLIAVPLGVGCALFLSEVSRSGIKEYVSVMIELLAAIPSVVYGLWGIFVLGPWLAVVVQPWLKNTLGFLPIFQGTPFGLSMFSAGIILAIMILPIITALSRDVFLAIPHSLRESAQALGATWWETCKLALLGPSRSGIIGAVILGLGRALGETMAVTMVIGNTPQIKASIFAPAYTLASVIANEFSEAVSELNLAVLFELALVLLAITIVINGLARLLVWKVSGVNKI